VDSSVKIVNMKSPITGKEMILTRERRSLEFRRETFEIVFHCYVCVESGETFTTTYLDELNLNQVYNQYRVRYNIPFPEEIVSIREKYGLSAAKMSEILGFGINSYRQYEAGEMPSIANAKLIQMVGDPKRFIEVVDMSGTLINKLKTKYIQKARALEESLQREEMDMVIKKYFLGSQSADVFSGYRRPAFEKLTEMVVYFSQTVQPFKTKMNKLLFYADFAMFRQSCFSISGARYIALDMGPVPNNFQSIFEYLANKGEVEIRSIEFQEGFSGEQFMAKEGRPFNPDLFSKLELEILGKVVAQFKSANGRDIIDLSHTEEAWKINKDDKSVISYEYAFALNQI